MHEWSLVRSLIRQVAETAADNDAIEVADVTIQIGPLSGVETALVQSAFEELGGTMNLIIEEVPLTIRCLQCLCVSELCDFVFRCKSCGSGRVKVTGGDEFRLISISLAEGAADVH